MLKLSVLALVLMRGVRSIPPNASDTTEFGTYQIEAAELQVVGEGPTKVSVESQNAAPRANAFSLRVSIDNSVGPAQQLHLTYRGNEGSGATAVTRTVELRAGERRHLEIPIAAEMNVGMFEVDGPGARGSQSVYFNVMTPLQHAVMVIGQATAFETYAGPRPQFTEADDSLAHVRAMVIPPSEAPSEAMAYSGYELVVVPDPTVLQGLTAAQRTALETYVLSGGSVVMRPTTAFALFENAPHQQYGLGTVVMNEGPLSTLQVPWAKPLLSPRARAPRWGSEASEHWQLLPQATPPLGIFLVIIVAFTLVIGPGSVWVARRRGPMALMVTIPSIAAATCGLIVAFSLLGEGFSVHSAVYSYTLLDSTRSRALTLGIGGYYANLSPRSMSLPVTTTLVTPWSQKYDRIGASYDWGEGISLGSDFMPSRRYREWGLVSLDPTRARLTLKREGESWVAQNALGAYVISVQVRIDGQTFSTTGIADGAQAQLAVTSGSLPKLVVPKPAPRPGLFNPTRTDYEVADGSPERFDHRLEVFFGRELDEGEFIATLGGQGFFPTAGVNAELHDGVHLVRGEVTR